MLPFLAFNTIFFLMFTCYGISFTTLIQTNVFDIISRPYRPSLTVVAQVTGLRRRHDDDDDDGDDDDDEDDDEDDDDEEGDDDDRLQQNRSIKYCRETESSRLNPKCLWLLAKLHQTLHQINIYKLWAQSVANLIKREDNVGPHQKWRHQDGGPRKTCWDFPGKQKTKVVWPLLEARTQPHLCTIAATRGFWEKKQRPTEKKMEGQHTGRHEEIPTDWRHGTRPKILDD